MHSLQTLCDTYGYDIGTVAGMLRQGATADDYMAVSDATGETEHVVSEKIARLFALGLINRETFGLSTGARAGAGARARSVVPQLATAAEVRISGVLPQDKLGSAIDVWTQLQERQAGSERLVAKRYAQTITIPVGCSGTDPNKLLAVNGGNHEARTKQLAGIDVLADMLRDVTVLYDADELLFTLQYGDTVQRWKCRHKWRYNSCLNPFHSFMRDLERNDDFDIAVGGHVHSGSHYVRFDHPSREANGPTDRYAFLIGCYEYHSKFAKQQGYSRHTGRGSLTLIIFPDTRLMIMDSTIEAARFLDYARATYPSDQAPIGITLMSDLHLGNAHTDYKLIYEEVRTIVTTPGLYAMLLGDLVDNWVGKLEGIQRQQPVSHDAEFVMLRSMLGALTGDPEQIKTFVTKTGGK